MRTRSRRMVFLLLLSVSVPALAQMFRWVDESGTVHYGSRCPEGVECTMLGSGPTPSQAEVEAARKRSEQLLEQTQARQEALRAQEQEQERARKAEALDERSTAAICEKALVERTLLEAQTPLYRDDSGVLRYRKSLHDYYYTGSRHYLADGERARDLFTVQTVIEQHCQGFKPKRFIYLKTFYQPPGTSEVIKMLGFPGNPVGPPLDELCAYARYLLSDIRAGESGIPDDETRALQQGIEETCR